MRMGQGVRTGLGHGHNFLVILNIVSLVYFMVSEINILTKFR